MTTKTIEPLKEDIRHKVGNEISEYRLLSISHDEDGNMFITIDDIERWRKAFLELPFLTSEGKEELDEMSNQLEYLMYGYMHPIKYNGLTNDGDCYGDDEMMGLIQDIVDVYKKWSNCRFSEAHQVNRYRNDLT